MRGCQVHLETGLQYTKDQHPNNINKFIDNSPAVVITQITIGKITNIPSCYGALLSNPPKSPAHSQVKDEEIVSTLQQKYWLSYY